MVLSNTDLVCGSIVFLLAILLIQLRKRRYLQRYVEFKNGMFKKAFDISEDAVLVLSEKSEIDYANKSVRLLLSMENELLDGQLDPVPHIKIKKEWFPLDIFIQQLPKNGKMHTFPQSKLSVNKKDQSIPVNLYVSHMRTGNDDNQCCSIVVIHDLRKEHECSTVAYQHSLTNLPNQLQAKIDLNKLYSKIHLHNKKLALVLVDIDNFSQIRVIIGDEQSQKILVHFARYLEQFAKENAFYVYHTFNNNFLLCLPIVKTVEETVSAAKKIQKSLGDLYKINGVDFHLNASVGISIYPDSGPTLHLMDYAYKALVKSQQRGYGHISIYTQKSVEEKYDKLALFNAVHEAFDKDEFEIFYQPIVQANDKEVVGAEALVRWKHGELGYIPPDVFIPMLEKSGFIIELGRYVLQEVLKQQKRWEVFKFKPIDVSINVSLPEIELEDFAEYVTEQLEAHQVSPEHIKFQITEDGAIENESLVKKQLEALEKLGISIAWDNFGTGYTSFAYLKKFPAEILKIDKTLVDHILEKKDDQRIVKAMIELGHNLGMKVAVEGIENKKMAEMISSYGCEYMQGYYFGKPLPAYEFQELIRR